MEKITQLTKAQESRLQEVYQEWLSIGRSTKPLDRPAVESIVVEFYKRIIEQPETITAKEILAEENAETRRVMIERIGMERFITESKAKVIHSHERGDLFSIDLAGDPEGVLRSVRVTDPSTGRIYFLRVPPTIKRADDAVAWTFGFDLEKDYRPGVES